MKRQSLKLDEIDWQALLGIACDCGCEYRGELSWRRLFDEIASGKSRPGGTGRTSAFAHFKRNMRRPIIEARQKQLSANREARMERDRLRQERKRRAAGSPAPRCPKRRWNRRRDTAMSSGG